VERERCTCGAFLCREPDRREPAQDMQTCDGKWHDMHTDPPAPVLTWPACGRITQHEAHEYPAFECAILHRKCTRCGRDNMEAQL
jgi:hypothetical protein